MNRPIYACDRCGHWYTLDKLFEHNDLPYEPRAVSGMTAAKWDLCAECYSQWKLHWPGWFQESPVDYEARKQAWFAAGKGAEVKPKSLRRP